jgi:hypothetical protein
VLERHEDAGAAARGIDRADERHEQQDRIVARGGIGDARRDHQRRGGQEKLADVVARTEYTDPQGEQRRAAESQRGDDTDVKGGETERGEIDRQHDGDEPVPEVAKPAREVDAGCRGHQRASAAADR